MSQNHSHAKLIRAIFASLLFPAAYLNLSIPAQTPPTPSAAGKPEPGLSATFTALDGDKVRAVDITVLPNIWLYVPARKSPTPFLPAGNFSAVWKGYVAVDLRAEYKFQAELNGELKLEINGQSVLESGTTDTAPAVSKPVRLSKGTNALTAMFSSPTQGDAFLRLSWSSKENPTGPIPQTALTHAVTADLKKADQLRLGRELLAEYRCLKCHAGPAPESSMLELALDAPAFEGIGSRRNFGWLSRWILDPKSLRPTAHMPKLLRGAKAKDDAEAMAAFLVSLKSEISNLKFASASEPAAEAAPDGKKLFDSLHCAACHNAPDANQTDAKKISLQHVREKFSPGTLAAFLQKPDANYAWTRMPRFKLADDEAGQLAAYLQSNAVKAKEISAPIDAALIERGKKLVQSTGCLNCHTLKLENQLTAKPLANLPPDKWNRGCLATTTDDASRAPEFVFTPTERECLQAFAATDRASLTRHIPADFAERQTRLLNCRECHGKFEGFPALDLLGGKLKPEWTKSFLAGEMDFKPRPWLEARMPAFPNRAEALAHGLAMQHGHPPQTPSEPPIDMEAAKVGQKLASALGGFSCVSCHNIGEVSTAQIIEAPGPNLAHSGARLLKPYFLRWLRNPLQIDPATKMPVYFDEEGRSPLADIYDGDSAKQVNALWQYLRLGDKMPPPPTQ